MDARRSLWLAPRVNDFDAASDAALATSADIPFVPAANDNVPAQVRLLAIGRALIRNLIGVPKH